MAVMQGVLTLSAINLSWSYYVYIAGTLITLPLHILILIVILRRQTLSPFHISVISQTTADIVSLLCSNFFTTLRFSRLCDALFWNSRDYLANVGFLIMFYNLYLRCIGIALISLQRYIVVCQVGSEAEKIIAKNPVLIFVILHWLSAFILTAPLMTSFDITYTPELGLDLPKEHLEIANLISMVTIASLFIVCAMCYLYVMAHMLRNKISMNRTKRNELRLTIQVAGLMIAFVLVFIYYVGQYILLKTFQNAIFQHWRLFYPITDGFLSWVQPWSCLCFNKDVQTRIKNLIKCRRTKILQVQSGTFGSPALAVLSLRKN